VIFPLTTFDQDLTKVMEEVKKRGEFITTLPAPEVLGENVLGFFLVFSSDLLEEEILEILSPYTPEIKGRYRLGKDLPSPQKQVSVETVKSLSQTVRVDIQKLDYVLSLVGELMMVRGAIQRLVDQMDSEYGLSHLTGEFKKVVRVFERRLQELQKRVMEVRMVPLRQIFDRMQRAVRQISQGMGKKIRVEIKGAETELDKLLVEELADPLLHILRNAVDHGIEPPSERKEKGKPDEGHIVLSAYQKGNHVVIEVQDDGRGISLEKIQRKALEKGWITPDQILTKKEILDFIFRPGFSTKEGVDELSGRGVGMDVVKNNITRLGGIVDIETEEGKGTKVILTLPVTLAIIQALVVQTSGNTYAIPLNSVLETFQISRKEIQRVDTQEILIHRGNPLPLIRLERIFQLVRMEKEPEDGYVVFVGLGEKRAGFLVDHLHGEQDVVLKPLQSILKKVPGIAGASDQGENPPILILDVAEILVEAGI
jgi:two-component system chemotaxis sensor kinase CheA